MFGTKLISKLSSNKRNLSFTMIISLQQMKKLSSTYCALCMLNTGVVWFEICCYIHDVHCSLVTHFMCKCVRHWQQCSTSTDKEAVLIRETAHGSQSLDHVADLTAVAGQRLAALCHLFTCKSQPLPIPLPA